MLATAQLDAFITFTEHELDRIDQSWEALWNSDSQNDVADVSRSIGGLGQEFEEFDIDISSRHQLRAFQGPRQDPALDRETGGKGLCNQQIPDGLPRTPGPFDYSRSDGSLLQVCSPSDLWCPEELLSSDQGRHQAASMGQPKRTEWGDGVSDFSWREEEESTSLYQRRPRVNGRTQEDERRLRETSERLSLHRAFESRRGDPFISGRGGDPTGPFIPPRNDPLSYSRVCQTYSKVQPSFKKRKIVCPSPPHHLSLPGDK